MKGKLEETVQGASSCIDGRNARRCQYDILLFGVGAYVLQESRFTRAGLAGEEHRLSGVLNQVQCILKLLVTGVYLHEWHFNDWDAKLIKLCFPSKKTTL